VFDALSKLRLTSSTATVVVRPMGHAYVTSPLSGRRGSSRKFARARDWSIIHVRVVRADAQVLAVWAVGQLVPSASVFATLS
jgi:hypothetical protein